MKHFLLFLLALLVSTGASAQTPKARPLTGATFQQVLHVAQDVTLDKVSTGHAYVAPLVVSAAGLGADYLKTPVYAFDAGLLPVLDLPNPTTQTNALNMAREWIRLNGRNVTNRIGNYLRDNGLSSGFFTYTQEFMMTTDLGLKKKAVAWSASTDPAGRPVYGEPKIVDPDPTYIVAMYYPKTVVSGLPESWASVYPFAGKLRYMVLNKKFEALTDWIALDANGAFDQEAGVTDGKLACLMDLRYPGCSGPFDIAGLLDKYGSAAAFVDYVRQLEPVYREEGDELVAEGAISYDKRVVDCGKLVNEGYFGFALQMNAERYLAEPTTKLVKYQMIQQFAGRTISPTEGFRKEVSSEVLGNLSPDRYVISPYPGDDSLWDRNTPGFSKLYNVIYVADLRSQPDGSGTFNVLEITKDMRATLVSESGPVREYYIGTVGNNYWPSGLYRRTVVFHTTNPKDTPEFAIIQAGWDDYIFVTLNGRKVYAGPYGGDMLSYGLAQGEQYCYEICEGGGDAGCNFTTVCKRGCPRNMAQWRSDARPTGPYSWSGCTPTELSTSWKRNTYVDLRPYLVPGVNTLEFTVLVKGEGEGWLKIRTQACSKAHVAPEAPPPPVPADAGHDGVRETNEEQAQREFGA